MTRKRLTSGALVTLLVAVEIAWLAALVTTLVWLIAR
jgi:hypothetical protein